MRAKFCHLYLMQEHHYCLIPEGLLVNECIENSLKVTPVPGVSSITSALSVSGFSDKFLFYGFLPKTENELEKVLSSLSKSDLLKFFLYHQKN